MRQRQAEELAGYFQTVGFIERKLTRMFEDSRLSIQEHSGDWTAVDPPLLSAFGDSILLAWDLSPLQRGETRTYLSLLLIMDVLQGLLTVGLTNGLTTGRAERESSNVLFRGAVASGMYLHRLGPSGHVLLGPAVTTVGELFEDPQLGAVVIDDSIGEDLRRFLDSTLRNDGDAAAHCMLPYDTPWKVRKDGDTGSRQSWCVNPAPFPLEYAERVLRERNEAVLLELGFNDRASVTAEEIAMRLLKRCLAPLYLKARETDPSAKLKLLATERFFEVALQAARRAAKSMATEEFTRRAFMGAFETRQTGQARW